MLAKLDDGWRSIVQIAASRSKVAPATRQSLIVVCNVMVYKCQDKGACKGQKARITGRL